MSAPDLDAIRARLDAATPGPWAANQGASGNWWIEQRNRSDVADMHPENANSAADAELIAHAPADLAALLAEVKRLTRWKAEATEVISAWEAIHGDLGEPGVLGESKAAATRAEVKRLTDERDREKGRADRHGRCVGCMEYPEAECPQHGRTASEWCEIASSQIGRANAAEAERDEARAALAALRGDVLGLGHIAKERGSVGVLPIAAVLANHPTTKEADRG